MGDAEINAANEIYEAARKSADIEITEMKKKMDGVRDESKTLGILQKIAYDDAHNKLFKYATLYQIKKSKSYKKGGMSWEDFCPMVTGESHRNINRILEDMRPVYDEFQDKLSCLLGLSFSKIRYLGRANGTSLSRFKDGCLIFDGEEIPLNPENREELEAAIDAMKDAHKKEVEDSKLATKVKERMVAEKNRTIEKQEKELSKFTKEIENRDYKPGEKEFIKQMDAQKHVITGVFLKLDPERMSEDTTSLMTAKYIEVLAYIKRMAQAHYDAALETRAQPDDISWRQPGLEPEPEESNSEVLNLFGE